MFKLHALGRLSLTGPDGHEILSVLAQPKRVAVLTYMALMTPRGFQRRDTLLGLFWPELDQEHARGALNQALSFLRRSLGDVIETRGDGEVGLSAERFWCDAVAFEATLDAGQLSEALELYQGDLLAGLFIGDGPEFEHWLLAERARLRRRATEAAWVLAEQSEAEGKGPDAERWARRATTFAPDDEGAIRRLIALLDRVGDRAQAVVAYEAFARRLSEEYELQPSPETQELIDDIRTRVESSPQFVTPELPPRAKPNDAVENDTAPAKAQRRRSFVPSVRTGAVAVILLSIFAAVRALTPPAYAVDEPRRSYVIFPFHVTSDNESMDWLAEVAANMLAQDLGGWQDIRVVDRRRLSELATARGVTLTDDVSLRDARAIGRDAEVGTIVLGSVTAQAGSVDIDVRLYDVATGDALSGPQQVSGSAGADLSPLFDRVAAYLLELSGSPEISPDVRAATTYSLAAYREYLAGLDHMYRWEMEAAAARYETAIEFDSTFALAYHRLGQTLAWDPRIAGSHHACDVTASAVRHSDRLPWREKQHALGLNLYCQSDFASARRVYQETLAADSSDAEAWYHLAQVELFDRAAVRSDDGTVRPRGDLNLALYGFERAVELDPSFHLGYGNVFQLLEYLRDPRDFSSHRLAEGSEDEDPEPVYFKSFWQQGSIATVRIDPEDLASVVRAYRTREGVDEVMRRATSLARRWSAAAPGTAQPHFILRDLLVEQFQYVDALQEHEAALRLVPDTTDRDLIELGVLTLAATTAEYDYYDTSLRHAGEYESALSLTHAGLALGVPGRVPYAVAGGVFIARGMPNEAIELIGSYYDDLDAFIPTKEGSVHFGASRPLLKRVQILGSTGMTEDKVRHAIESLMVFWAAKYDREELGLLHCIQTPAVAAALVQLGPDAARRWLGRFADPVPGRCRWDGTVEAIELLAGLGPGAARSTRAADVEAAVSRLEDQYAPPLPVTLYVLADIARRVERDDLAVELYSRMDLLTYAVPPRGRIGVRGLDSMGYDFGLLSLSYLHRARSYEALGETERARSYYRMFVDIWNQAEPELQHYADEALSRLDQLRGYPRSPVIG